MARGPECFVAGLGGLTILLLPATVLADRDDRRDAARDDTAGAAADARYSLAAIATIFPSQAGTGLGQYLDLIQRLCHGQQPVLAATINIYQDSVIPITNHKNR